jgi:competence CoiA-like predicted nuclease
VQASPTPDFNTESTFKMRRGEKLDLERVLRENEPLNLVLIERNYKNKKQTIITTKRIEWRHILYCKSIEQEVLLTRIDLHNKNPLGTLNVTFIL